MLANVHQEIRTDIHRHTLSEFHTGLGAGIVACAYSNEDRQTNNSYPGRCETTNPLAKLSEGECTRVHFL